MIRILILLILNVFLVPLGQAFAASADVAAEKQPLVVVLKMDMMILPGTAEYLSAGLSAAAEQHADLIVVKLNTPGGMLETTQGMIQDIFRSEIPVVVFVSPQGGTATSAGVFITMAGHVAAMSPGTSIGSATPVMGDGKDIEGDMKKKAENMTVALVKSISQQRGRNIDWIEKAIREANSVTEREALQLGVIDIVANDLPDLLRQLRGRDVNIGAKRQKLGDFSQARIQDFEISLKDRVVNLLANPSVAALLWLGATTGLSIELYNPGAILPGVVGLICLVLALISSQILPVTQGGVVLIILGGALIGAELYVTSGILGIGGIIAMMLGALYLVDVAAVPGVEVAHGYVSIFALILGSLLLFAVSLAVRTARRQVTTGREGIVGMDGEALENFSESGRVRVIGEIWDATLVDGLVQKGERIEVVAVKDGLLLEVKRKQA